MATKKVATPSNVVQLPPDWKSSFQGHAMRSSFCLALTQPMLEFLCATADGVHWDRRLYYRQWGGAKPDNWLASGRALENRGLIERITRSEGDWSALPEAEHHLHANCRLTPAGEAIVNLLKVSGIFVESDAAVEKRSKAPGPKTSTRGGAVMNRQMIANVFLSIALMVILVGAVGAVIHFEKRTRPAGAEPWCLPCPVVKR